MTKIDWHSIPQQDPQPVPVLAPDAHRVVDWDRVRRTVRAVHPVRCLVVIGAGLYPAVVWCNRVAEPLSERSVHTAFAAGAVTSAVCLVGLLGGGVLRKWASAILLFAAVGGTLLADPTRNLIATWIVGA
ncbi:hypothetical protein [Streptomyces sp. NPDC096033]|uniref:hypothetical protein n=1 Tax=Streptomyces sp. NPDC096033 TaxID=3366071 RepID=UPI00381E3CF4